GSGLSLIELVTRKLTKSSLCRLLCWSTWNFSPTRVTTKPSGLSLMPFSLLKNWLRENTQCIGRGKGAQQRLREAHSMHRVPSVLCRVLFQDGGHRLGARDRHVVQPAHVLDVAQPAEQAHHGFFARGIKGFPGQILGISQG